MVKASFFCEITMVTRGIETRLQILFPHKKSIGWAVGAKVTSRRYYDRRKPNFQGVRMAEWLRPGLWEILMLSRGIEPGQVLTSKKST